MTTPMEKVLAVTKELLSLVPDEEKREALERELEAAQETTSPEPEAVEGAISASQVERLKTAIGLLSGITAESTQESADNIIMQAIASLKALTSEGYEKPKVNIDYGEDKPLVGICKVDESFKGNEKPIIKGRLLEAVEGTKNRYRICVVESGLSKNGVEYPIEVLRNRVEFYDYKPMYVDHSLQEGASPTLKGDVSTVVNPQVDEKYECSNGSIGAIVAEAVIHNQEWQAQVAVPEFRQRLGISHVVQAKTRESSRDGQSIRIAEDIMPEQVDWVSREAAGGRVLEHEPNREDNEAMSKINESMTAELRKLRAKDEARDILMLSESLDPTTKMEIIQEVGDIAAKSEQPIDVKVITEAISKRYESAIERATKKHAPAMAGGAAGSAPEESNIVDKASESLGAELFGA